ncbi:unnamed protein product [Pleuronectes platessa]|uniref:Uncharacterized protein n=1 Tax=Pleuronectes platessa TaxID=8262 RepID=A0A9N7UDH4_PLEPL|nr:unnamed protein product [Pleuronectes platessa]
MRGCLVGWSQADEREGDRDEREGDRDERERHRGKAQFITWPKTEGGGGLQVEEEEKEEGVTVGGRERERQRDREQERYNAAGGSLHRRLHNDNKSSELFRREVEQPGAADRGRHRIMKVGGHALAKVQRILGEKPEKWWECVCDVSLGACSTCHPDWQGLCRSSYYFT